MLTLARMRLSVLGVGVQLLLVTSAYAGRSGGSEGGGRLGQVSGGLSRATGSSGGGGGRGGNDSGSTVDHRSGSSGPRYRDQRRGRPRYREQWRDCPTDVMPRDFGPNPPPSTQRSSSWCNGRYIAVIDSDGKVVREYQPFDPGPPNIDGFVGVQKVVESNSAISASLSIDDKLLRLAVGFTRYQEQQMDGSQLTLTLPSLAFGVRIDGGGPTRVFLEGGVAQVKTKNEPMGDSSITGATIGVHLEHRFNAKGNRALVGDAHAMYFESDVKAYAARLGVRIGYVEAAVRVLDLNVGPALYGPEVGLRF